MTRTVELAVVAEAELAPSLEMFVEHTSSYGW